MARKKGRPKSGPDPAVEERRRRVATMLLSGGSGRQIAEAVGVSHTTIQRDIAAIRAEWHDIAQRSYDDWLAEELATLALLQRQMLPMAMGTGAADPADRQRAAAKVLDIMARRAKLLGLDAPERHEVLTMGTIEAEIAKLEQQMSAEDRAAVDAVTG